MTLAVAPNNESKHIAIVCRAVVDACSLVLAVLLALLLLVCALLSLLLSSGSSLVASQDKQTHVTLRDPYIYIYTHTFCRSKSGALIDTCHFRYRRVRSLYRNVRIW